MIRRKLTKSLFLLVTLTAILIACALPGLPGGTPSPSEPPAAQLLPDLPGYKIVEGQELGDTIGKVADSELLQKESPNLAELIAKVDGVIGCYQEVGAARARIYSNLEQPWSVGAIAIADRNAMLSPANLFKCVGSGSEKRQMQSQAASPTIEPCSAKYTLPHDDNEFYILYVGTTPQICHDFCANLEGCTAH